MTDNSNLNYIKEMEKNSKIFEEKMNKFKKYKNSSIYNEPEDYHVEEELDTKYSSNKNPKNLEEKPYEEYNYDYNKKNNPSNNKNKNRDKYDYYEEENILDYDYDYDNKNKNKIILKRIKLV